ncbi:MAG: triose-phosphate isomerase, partial [bacterium]
NWKMNLGAARSGALASATAASAASHASVEVCIFPPFVYLAAVACARGTASVGGQDCSAEKDGAFTGQVSASMLVDLGCSHVLIGHSERRHGLGESDAVLSKKLVRALEAGLRPVVCVGETLAEREAGRAHDVIRAQLRGTLGGHAIDADRLVIAYEPVWAIGTGRTASADDAAEAHRTVRQTLADLYDVRFAESVRVIYGGSVNAKNAAELFARVEIDGGLVGGASLVAADFASIISAAALRARRVY